MSDLNKNIDAKLFNAVKVGNINEVERLISEGADVNAFEDLLIPLYWAAKNNYPNIIEVLLDNGANIDLIAYPRDRDVLNLLKEKEAEYSKSSLHLAAKLCNLEEAENILKRGADINAENDYGNTPLHLAAKEGCEKVVKALLDKGANVDVKNHQEYTPLNLATEEEIRTLLEDTAALLEAAKNGYIDRVNSLINAGANINAVDKYENTPLHLAAKNGHTGIVSALINAKADVNAKNAIDMTPLLYASKDGHKDVVKILLDNGADVNAENSLDGLDSLHWAAKNGHTGVVEVLLTAKEIDVVAVSRELISAAQNGYTGLVEVLLTAKEIDVDDYFIALNLAVVHNHEGVVKVLLTTEKIDVAAKDASGKTLLHWAVEKGYREIVEALLSRGSDVNVVDKDGNTPLHWAAKNGHKVVVEALLSRGSDVNVVDKDGNTPLHWAAKNGHKVVVEALLEKEGISVDAVDKDGNTPLHLASEKGYVEIVNTLLGKEADVNVKNSKGETPLYLAVACSHVDIVKALIKEGADVNKARGFANLNDEILALLQDAALLDAAKNSDVDEVKRLISEGADVNAKDKDGRTPLHLASLNGFTKIVGTLIKAKGIDIYAKDNENNAPLDLARQNNQNEVVEVLGKAQKNIEALYLAVKDGSAQEVEKLLQDLLRKLSDVSIGANINIVDKNGNTPLHFAASLNKTEVVKILIDYLADVTIKNKDKKTPFDLAKTEEIETLLKEAVEKSDDGESSTDNEGDHEEDAGEEKQQGDVQPDTEVSEEGSQSGQGISTEEGNDLKTEGVVSVASAQTEEQPSSFFDSLFNIVTSPFSLIASFFSGFFLWLFSSNGEKADEFTSQSGVSLLTSDSLDDDGYYTTNTDF